MISAPVSSSTPLMAKFFRGLADISQTPHVSPAYWPCGSKSVP
jgi:hypothetical protein